MLFRSAGPRQILGYATDSHRFSSETLAQYKSLTYLLTYCRGQRRKSGKVIVLKFPHFVQQKMNLNNRESTVRTQARKPVIKVTASLTRIVSKCER